jgi:hypothetical protein
MEQDALAALDAEAGRREEGGRGVFHGLRLSVFRPASKRAERAQAELTLGTIAPPEARLYETGSKIEGNAAPRFPSQE